MSFLPPHNSAPVEAEVLHQRELEIEARAARYAERHPDGNETNASPGIIARMAARGRALVGRRH